MKGSVYMRWAKEHAAARFNLANSGLLGVSTEDLEIVPEDLLINGPNADGYPPLLAAIGARYGVEPDRVVLAPGASGANFLAFATLVDPGDEVLVETPAYEPILAALRFAGASIRRFGRSFVRGWRVDLENVAHGLARSDRVRLVVLTSPHNPSGVLTDPEDLAEIARLAEAAGALVVVDEVYLDIWSDDAVASHVHVAPNVVTTSSLTKSYGLSGLRCGWVLCPSVELADRMRRVNDFMGAVGSMPSEALSLAAFRQLSALTARSRSILEPNLRRVHAFLAEHADLLDCVVPRRSMTVFPRLRNEEDSEALHDWLRDHETSIVPGKFFEEPRHFRLGFAVRPRDVEQGLERLSAGLRRRG
jgi:aspartate/methionine/tyrosine aminotransferase